MSETQKIPLLGGMYEARSVIASAQRCVNLYPERNAEDAPFPLTCQLTPGLLQLIEPLNAPSRCAFTASNGKLFEVIGSTVYYTNSKWIRQPLGTIPSLITPVSMADNGLVVLIVDGTPSGYVIELSSNRFAPVSGQNSAFYGGDRVDFVDTFFVLNRPGTAQWYISLSNATFANMTGTISPGATAAAFDPLDIAAKTGNPDPIQSVIVMHREPWLIGTETTEVWYDSGSPQFAFAELPGVFIEHGSVAKYSICKQDLMVYWLSQDRQGTKIVLMGNQYAARRISTHSIEQQLSMYDFVSDAIGFTYQQLGHTFYVLTFPSANATWVYDVAENLWHERTYTDNNGLENRIRPATCASAYGIIVVGDWQNGALYQWDLDTYTDNSDPIVRRRGWPDIQLGNKRAEHSRLVLDIGVGEIVDTLTSDVPHISLRYSDDRGRSWGNSRLYSLGSTGQYSVSVLFTQLGQARNRVYEVFWAIPTFTALNGGDVWVTPSET